MSDALETIVTDILKRRQIEKSKELENSLDNFFKNIRLEPIKESELTAQARKVDLYRNTELTGYSAKEMQERSAMIMEINGYVQEFNTAELKHVLMYIRDIEFGDGELEDSNTPDENEDKEDTGLWNRDEERWDAMNSIHEEIQTLRDTITNLSQENKVLSQRVFHLENNMYFGQVKPQPVFVETSTGTTYNPSTIYYPSGTTNIT